MRNGDLKKQHPFSRKGWHDLSQRQKTGIVVQGVLQLALMGWTLAIAHASNLGRAP